MVDSERSKCPNGEIESLFHRLLFFPRATHYQELCIRLAGLALDLSVPSYQQGCQVANLTVRHCDKLRVVDLERWILKVLEENVLAGMVLIDALDYVMELLGRLAGTECYDCFAAQTKKRFTERIGNTWVEFQVPVGWELVLAHETRLVGFRGVAVIERCHLSQNTQHVNDAVGKLVGVPLDQHHDIGYFDIQCGFLPGCLVEGNEIVRPANAAGYALGISLPYIFITREIQKESSTLQLRLRPTDQEVFEIAKTAVERLTEAACGQAGTDEPT